MNAPNETDLAALRAECDVLRLMLSLVIREKIDREHAPGIGDDIWCGTDMAAAVVGLVGPDDTPEAHLEAFSRFCDSVRDAAGPRRRQAATAGRHYGDRIARVVGD
jgi:hypothetical protein